jgi:hypothetical protein
MLMRSHEPHAGHQGYDRELFDIPARDVILKSDDGVRGKPQPLTEHDRDQDASYYVGSSF